MYECTRSRATTMALAALPVRRVPPIPLPSDQQPLLILRTELLPDRSHGTASAAAAVCGHVALGIGPEAGLERGRG